MEVPLARAPTGSTRSPLRAPPGSPKSPLRAPPGSPKSPLRVPPGSPRSDLPPLPPPVSPNSRPKLFFLLSKVPHWLFAISGFSLYKPDISLLLLLPPHLLMHSPSTYCLFEKVFFRISITSLPLFSFLFFLFTLSLLFCHLSAVYSLFAVTAITWFYPRPLSVSFLFCASGKDSHCHHLVLPGFTCFYMAFTWFYPHPQPVPKMFHCSITKDPQSSAKQESCKS